MSFNETGLQKKCPVHKVTQILALLVNLMKDYKTNSQKISFK